jgi:hypothetical protein
MRNYISEAQEWIIKQKPFDSRLNYPNQKEFDLITGLLRTVKDYQEVIDSHNRLVKQLDVMINGIDGAAEQASLCDIIAQIGKGEDW